MELGKFRLQVSEGNLTKFVKDVTDLFILFAEEHQIDYKVTFDPVQLSGWFDHEKVEIILMNLIGNAFKFTPDSGQIHIHVMLSQTNHDPKHQWIEIRVADTGIGIPPDRLDHIFDRFYHVEHPGKLFYDSIGIGLDFTKEIVELHKGSITVESQVKKGSTFHVRIPISREAFSENDICQSDQKTAASELSIQKIEEIKEERKRLHVSVELNHQEKTGSLEQKKKPRVLIAEDHPEMLEMLAQFFEEDYEVLQAENGRDGMRIAFQEVPDLIISDIMMPEMDGIEFAKHLKTNVITSHIPILLLTVKSGTEYRIEGFETGADAYISKPFEYDELHVRVQKLIESRELLKKRFSREVEINPKEVTVNKLDETFLENCISLIEEKISEQDFNVERLCIELGMSRTQAYKKVKSLSGFALNEFIIQIKLKRAAKMLIETSMNISEIAYTLGFNDHSHMNRHFRNAFNCSPKVYRREHMS